jgi:hypothetical protein
VLLYTTQSDAYDAPLKKAVDGPRPMIEIIFFLQLAMYLSPLSIPPSPPAFFFLAGAPDEVLTR